MDMVVLRLNITERIMGKGKVMNNKAIFKELETLSEPEPKTPFSVSSLPDIAVFLNRNIQKMTRKYILVTLSTQNEVLKIHNLDSFISRTIFTLSILDNAAGFFLVRIRELNADVRPTVQERILISSVFSDSETLGISLYDYVVYTNNSIFSMADNNLKFDFSEEEVEYEL